MCERSWEWEQLESAGVSKIMIGTVGHSSFSEIFCSASELIHPCIAYWYVILISEWISQIDKIVFCLQHVRLQICFIVSLLPCKPPQHIYLDNNIITFKQSQIHQPALYYDKHTRWNIMINVQRGTGVPFQDDSPILKVEWKP